MDFFKKIIDMQKTTCYFIFEKMEIILKANLLKGRDAKPEGAKVRKFDQVSRLPLFPYHIWKNVKTEEISITFILYRCVILKKCSRDTGIFWQVSFLYAKMGTKTGRDRFSVYR